MNINRFIAILLLVLPVAAQADSLFKKELAGGRTLPLAFGIGIDYFTLDQPYEMDSLTLNAPPGVPFPTIADLSLIKTSSDATNTDVKFDVWLLPFLNVFAVYGQVDGDTVVDLSNIGVPLPPEITRLAFDYDGDVYGVGAVLVVGGDRWFATLASTFTDTSLGGGFNTSVQTTTIQPRVGLRFGDKLEGWVGGYMIDTEESHSGTINLDLGFGPLPITFAADLSQKKDFNLSAGVHVTLSQSWEATLEIGGGDRDTVLANLTYRFE